MGKQRICERVLSRATQGVFGAPSRRHTASSQRRQLVETLEARQLLTAGTITRELWTSLPGYAISDLTSSPNYPNNPNQTAQLTSIESGPLWASDYGTRVRGYVTAPATGQYTFWVSGDDTVELILSSDENPANAQKIAWTPEWSYVGEWDKNPQQQSAAIQLLTGQRYYIEVLQKQAGGLDGLAAAWQGPDGAGR